MKTIIYPLTVAIKIKTELENEIKEINYKIKTLNINKEATNPYNLSKEEETKEEIHLLLAKIYDLIQSKNTKSLSKGDYSQAYYIKIHSENNMEKSFLRSLPTKKRVNTNDFNIYISSDEVSTRIKVIDKKDEEILNKISQFNQTNSIKITLTDNEEKIINKILSS